MVQVDSAFQSVEGMLGLAVETSLRITRGGFVVIKLLISDRPYLLLRKNPKWNDLNLIGGHEKDRDHGILLKTAQRELWEEVPSIREIAGVRLEALTPEVTYGPVYSRSAGCLTCYQIQFFGVQFEQEPTFLLQGIGVRSRNVLVLQDSLLPQNSSRVSGLINFLQKLVPGGIASIPVSSVKNLSPPVSWSQKRLDQLELSLI